LVQEFASPKQRMIPPTRLWTISLIWMTIQMNEFVIPSYIRWDSPVLFFFEFVPLCNWYCYLRHCTIGNLKLVDNWIILIHFFYLGHIKWFTITIMNPPFSEVINVVMDLLCFGLKII
jgi:hypothetical protein